MLGAVIGMLEPEAADSPIDQAQSMQATTVMTQLDQDIRDKKNERRAFTQQIAGIQLVWKNSPEVHNLIAPDIRNIRVPLTEKVRDGEEGVDVKKTR